MTVKIKDYTQNLESMVEQRTKEVVQSKETLQSVLSNSPIILFLLDPKGLILFAEGRGLEKFGVEGSQIIGFKLNDLFNELSDIGNMLEITEFGKEFKREEIIEGIYFEINITALREEKDKVAGYIGLFLDITERKRAETVMARKLFYEEQLALCSQKMIEDKPEVLEEVLEILLKTSNASRVYILKLSNIIVENNLKPEYLFEAINPNSNIQKRNYHFRKSHKNLKNVIMHFKKSLSDEKFINWNLETMPGEFIPFFRKLKIYSILYVPFYIKGEWSGFICFEDNNQPKKWGYEDINLLQTSAGLIVQKWKSRKP